MQFSQRGIESPSTPFYSTLEGTEENYRISQDQVSEDCFEMPERAKRNSSKGFQLCAMRRDTTIDIWRIGHSRRMFIELAVAKTAYSFTFVMRSGTNIIYGGSTERSIHSVVTERTNQHRANCGYF